MRSAIVVSYWPPNSHLEPLRHVTVSAHRFDVLLQNLGDGLRVFSVLLCDDGQVADLVFVVGLEISKRLSEVFSNIGGGRSGERAARRASRHCKTITRVRSGYFKEC